MRSQIAQKISNAILVVRDYHYAELNNEPFSKFKLKSAQHYLEEICIYLDHKSSDTERDFLFSCLGALDELMEQGNDEKISRFAHAIHRIPFIFSGEEKWDKNFKREYILPFCDIYGDEYFSEILNVKVPLVTASPKGVTTGKRTIYRYNEINILSLPAYFGFRFMFPIIIIPFLIGAILYVHYSDYTETNRGERYEITADSFEYEHTDEYDYLYIMDNDFSEQFEISRFFEFSNSPEQLIELCESKSALVVYAKYKQPKNYDPYYEIIHLEDTNGNVFRSYEQTNQIDSYILMFLIVALLVVLIPSLALFIMMLIVARNPQKYVLHPKFVKFCFPNYSLRLKKQ